MKLTAVYHGGTRYDIVSGRHRIITDQAVEDGGQDAGMGPVELFVGSVASCVAYFVGQFCGGTVFLRTACGSMRNGPWPKVLTASVVSTLESICLTESPQNRESGC